MAEQITGESQFYTCQVTFMVPNILKMKSIFAVLMQQLLPLSICFYFIE